MGFVIIDGQPVHTSTLGTGPVEINREHPAISAFLAASSEWRVALSRELLKGTGYGVLPPLPTSRARPETGHNVDGGE